MDEVPLSYQILCVLLTGCFVLSFNIARDPRKWRRFYQSQWQNGVEPSVNRNKQLDENLRRYGIIIAMVLLLADVFVFVTMLTYPSRMREAQMSRSSWDHFNEQKKIESRAPVKTNSGLR